MIIYDAQFAKDIVENIRFSYENGYPVNHKVINNLIAAL